MINIIRTCVVLCMILSFNLSYAADCSADANVAAQQAFNWFNPVETLSDSDGKITFCYTMNFTTECVEPNYVFIRFKATAQCDTSTGTYIPYSSGFYDKSPPPYPCTVVNEC